MEYLIGLLLLILVTALIYVSILSYKKRIQGQKNHRVVSVNKGSIVPRKFDMKAQTNNDIVIFLEQLSLATAPSNNQLVEISNKSIIACINDTIPYASNLAEKTVRNNELGKMDIYKAIIPSGKELVKSKGKTGLVRGFYMNAKGVEGHADFSKVNPNELSKVGTVADGVANVMNVASLVVGQYYMTEINYKLETISKQVDKISDFQEREFKSRILSLIASVRTMSNFSLEIIENDELRKRKLQTLEDLQGEAANLLQQVNLAIDEIIKKNQNLVYKDYQIRIEDLNTQIYYQKALIATMEEIGKLFYMLGKGEISSEMSYSMSNLYIEQSKSTKRVLEEWHNKHIDSLGINILQNQIRKKGVERVVSEIPSIIDKKWKYKELETGLSQKIMEQLMNDNLLVEKPKDVYSQEVQIVIKEGKYYYLHD